MCYLDSQFKVGPYILPIFLTALRFYMYVFLLTLCMVKINPDATD